MSYTEEYTEVHDYLGGLPPITANSIVGVHNTGFMNMADYHRLFTFLDIGEPAGALSTIDIAVQQATSAAGAGAVALPLKAPWQVAFVNAGEHVGIELRTEELNVTGGFSFVNVEVTVGGEAYTYSLTAWGIVSRYEAVGIADFLQVVP